jgi:ABC-type Mn2+/Zn2+ transport system ATPase subunit
MRTQSSSRARPPKQLFIRELPRVSRKCRGVWRLLGLAGWKADAPPKVCGGRSKLDRATRIRASRLAAPPRSVRQDRTERGRRPRGARVSEAEKIYRLLFVKEIAPAQASSASIYLAPSAESWNDFGFQARCDILVVPRESAFLTSRPIRLQGYFGYSESAGSVGDMRGLRERLAQNNGPLPVEALQGHFTMLRDLAAYRELVSKFGPEEARIVLRTMHDVVEAEESVGTPGWLKSGTESQLFRKAFLRTSEAFFAWRNAGDILEGTEFEPVSRLSDELRISFRLAGRPNDHVLGFRFKPEEEILPKRFAIIIGQNGVGKSQTIGRIADAAIRGLDTLTDGQGERPSFNRVLAFYPTAVASDAFPPERRRRSRTWYRRFSLGGPGYGPRRKTTADLVVELARSTEHIRDASRFEIFSKAIFALDASHELAVVVRDYSIAAIAIDDLFNGGEEQLVERFGSVDPHSEVVRYIDGKTYGLSSGELSFVRFAAIASLHIENSSLLLLDEPETHLHPAFISQFVMLLDTLLEQTGSAAIIATHSAYFVREAFEDQVQVLRSGPNREILIEEPVLRTFGADVGTISWFVFGEDKPSRLARSVEKRIAEHANSWDQAFKEYKSDLSLDLLGEIRAEIEDRGAR